MCAPTLPDLQALFWHSLADDPGGFSLSSRLIEVVEPSATLDRLKRLRVYADSYFWRLRDILRDDFPSVAKTVGPELFEQLVRVYLRAHPSKHPSVRWVGSALADFLERRSDVPGFLSGLARLEWARNEVFDAADSETIEVEALRQIPPPGWPSLRFVPIPAIAIVEAAWPVHRIWDDGVPADMAPARTTIQVWRARDFTVLHRAVDQRTAKALRSLMLKEPFAAICTAFEDLDPPQAASEASTLLARWLNDGIIARVE